MDGLCETSIGASCIGYQPHRLWNRRYIPIHRHNFSIKMVVSVCVAMEVERFWPWQLECVGRADRTVDRTLNVRLCLRYSSRSVGRPVGRELFEI